MFVNGNKTSQQFEKSTVPMFTNFITLKDNMSNNVSQANMSNILQSVYVPPKL